MRRNIGWLVLGLIGSFLVGGCATEKFHYVPSEHPAPNSRVHDEAVYSVPQNAEGEDASIRIASDGLTEMKLSEGNKAVRTLHLKLSVTNKRKKGAWTIHASDLSVAYPNTGRVRPGLIQPAATADGRIEVQPGELRTVELFFPIPQEIRSSGDLPEFDFHWQLRSGTELVTETTLFDRVKKPEYSMNYPSTFYPYYFGVGPAWFNNAAPAH